MDVEKTTWAGLLEFATQTGGLKFGDAESDEASSEKIRQMLQLVVSCPEYQYA